MKWILVFVFMIKVAPGFAQNDIDAIKAVITRETTSFFNVDYKTWTDVWLKVPYAYWSYADNDGTTYTEGWQDLSGSFADYFQTSHPSKGKIIHEWIEFRIYETGAFVRFNQIVNDGIDVDKTSQIRILEKKEGVWKIVCVGAIAMHSNGNELQNK